ncbi:hypothetical protein ALQ04_01303 [Pseudomonas cichorii]|uniref:Uncharacterized protein n=1 Tax=Pseudomonas cichorii TaxID=36746 RepID=A0A3M4M7J3_PSECI|nr:fibronectin type III domain-containing protein [Pseudomonas cichorii]RMQ49797.1 hypothetical protein ALQ04_01303 [Pseudomonas cichorii]
MNKNNKQLGHAWMAGVLLTIASQTFAQVESIVESSTTSVRHKGETQEVLMTGSTFLDDRIHQLGHTLQSDTSEHRYHFIARRGQDVLLSIPQQAGSSPLWKVEYQLEGGEWKIKSDQTAEVIRDLKPGTRVNIRVRANDNARFDKADYQLVFGSYPYMRYELRSEEGFLKIPQGLTQPPFLATQAYRRVLLNATFTDSKDHPLAGGVMDFRLEPHAGYKEIHEVFTSDSRGRISRFIEFERCEGGELAGNFVHKSVSRNIWSTRYKVGKYSASNVLAGSLEDKPHEYAFGHICQRTLVSGAN